MNPALARASLRHGHGFAFREEPEKIREVHAGRDGKGMPTPDARIDVEKLKAAVARIFFEFDFGEACEAGGGQQALSRRNDLRLVHRFDKGAELAKVLGVLPETSGDDGRQRKAIFAEGGVGELGFAASGDHFLSDEVL